MIPLVLAVAGALALGAAAAILRSFGPRYRVGRLLAVAPKVGVAEALRLVESGATAYVRVDGRIDSEEEFEDEHHRPLVLRRTTLRWRRPGGRGAWATIEPTTERVTFTVREGMDEIGVEGDDLREGLIVVPRIRQGKAGDLGDGAPAGVPPEADLTMTVEQLSSVEHATVAGVPRRGRDGRVVMGAGMGRPLLLTTLERDEAMRVLTGGATGRSRAAVALLVLGAALLGIAALWFLVDALTGSVATALAASPDPTLRPNGDTRTPGAGPGFVGEPVLAILGVVALGVVSVATTLAYVRWSGGRRSRPGPGR